MPQVSVESKKFPGIAFVCPQIPGLPEQKGSHYFAVGTAYEVTDETLTAIQQQLADAPSAVKNEIRLLVAGSISISQTLPPPPPPSVKPAVSESSLEDPEATTPEEITELSDEDFDLIEVEVSKLIGKQIQDSQPQLVATAGNVELSKTLRLAYLDKVIANHQIKKALKDVAESLKTQIEA